MRIAIVSAHYPPDFVSGGTLVPQRHARALRERGHDVRVFAGSLSLTTQADEVEETGLPVHWVPVRDGIAWSSPLNTANDAVVAAFATWLAEVRPDVVHLHALQAMGGGMVRAAKESGARVVVTMHDFWWTCARQFLVDKGFRPCSLVVDAGVCGCEVDRPWLDARNAQLAEDLSYADVVCVPSAVARDLVAANGLAPGVLVVDENGLPVPATTGAPTTSATVRFLFAGGKNRLKGGPLLLDAVGRLTGDWSLTLVGGDELARDTGWSAGHLPVTLRPAYAPEELSDVLLAHDVLVLPSLMRESFSIVAREALQHGLAVVTSDTLGPEEVVRHGVNGLVVATGSAEDLAAAMQSLVDDRALLTRLRSAPAPTVRTLDEQVDGLERLYAETSSRPPSSTVRDVLFVCGIEGAPLRYRARLPAEALALQGLRTEVRHYRDAALPELVSKADVVVVYRVPATHQVLDLIQGADVPVLFDVDDLIVDPSLRDEIPAMRSLPADEAELWMQGVHRYRTTLETCDGYVGSTQPLVDHIGALTGLPAYRFSNGVGLVTARRSDAALRRPRTPGPLRVGYLSGTTTHDADWHSVEAAVLEVLARHPGSELWLVGHLQPTDAVAALGDRVKRLPLQDWRALPALIRDLDVNLAPLELDLGEGGRFNEAKSAIKHLEAALVEVPTVASPTQPYREAIEHGVNGMLAAGHDEWVAALDALLSDAAMRHRIGARARRDVLLQLSPHLQGRRYLAVLEQAVARGRLDRVSDWEPVALDGPPARVSLEPYTAEPVAGPTRAEQLRERALVARERAAAVLAREGVGGVLRATARVTGRRLRRR